MRSGPSDSQARGNLRRSVRVSSWLGAELLADEIPVSSGTFTESDDQQIPELVRLTVPLASGGVSWDPGTDTRHPLARFGQRLFVVLDVTPAGTSDTFEVPLGWFRIQSWDIAEDESSITVQATGRLQDVADDVFRGPEQPRSGGTFASEFRRLMTGGIPVAISEDLSDRACPASFTWDEDRLDALYDLADAWPARILTTADGEVAVLPPVGATHTPVLTLTDGEGGVLMSAPRGDSREGTYNAVVARSSKDAAESTPVSAEFVTTSGPYATSTYGTVRRRYASPVLGSVAACTSAARTVALTSQRKSRTIRVSMPPDPRVQRGDPVRLTWDGVNHDGWVTAVSLPLTVSDGAGSLTVEVPS